jgi:hypothetical protein
VDDPFGEVRPILSGQAPSLQLMGRGDGTLIVLQAANDCKLKERQAQFLLRRSCSITA